MIEHSFAVDPHASCPEFVRIYQVLDAYGGNGRPPTVLASFLNPTDARIARRSIAGSGAIQSIYAIKGSDGHWYRVFRWPIGQVVPSSGRRIIDTRPWNWPTTTATGKRSRRRWPWKNVDK